MIYSNKYIEYSMKIRIYRIMVEVVIGGNLSGAAARTGKLKIK